MQLDLDSLKISEEDLEQLSGLEINNLFMGNVCRPSILYSSEKLLGYILTQVLWLGLICIFVIPVGFILAQNIVNLPESVFKVLRITLGISLMITLAWNFYTWLKGKRMTSLANLLDEVDKYNEVVQAVEVIYKLTAVGSSEVDPNRKKVTEALSVTRDSLVSALMVERILRENKDVIARRHQLLTNIENNLSALMTLEVKQQASEYGGLINSALSIGMSVQEEMQKLQS